MTEKMGGFSVNAQQAECDSQLGVMSFNSNTGLAFFLLCLRLRLSAFPFQPICICLSESRLLGKQNSINFGSVNQRQLDSLHVNCARPYPQEV